MITKIIKNEFLVERKNYSKRIGNYSENNCWIYKQLLNLWFHLTTAKNSVSRMSLLTSHARGRAVAACNYYSIYTTSFNWLLSWDVSHLALRSHSIASKRGKFLSSLRSLSFYSTCAHLHHMYSTDRSILQLAKLLFTSSTCLMTLHL